MWLVRWRVAQSVSVLLTVLNWLVLANEIPSIGVIAKSIAAAGVTILELLCIVSILITILGVLLSALVGEKMQKWSGFGFVLSTVWRHFVVGMRLLPRSIALSAVLASTVAAPNIGPI